MGPDREIAEYSRIVIQLRSVVGTSQKVFAESIGVSRSLVSAVESGTRLPNVAMLQGMRHRYGISIDAIFDGLEKF